jgi:hypothetical protein
MSDNLLGKDRAKKKVLFIFIFLLRQKIKYHQNEKLVDAKIGLDKIK